MSQQVYSSLKFYHGTTECNWKEIQEEGILLGRRFLLNDCGQADEITRCTYLAMERDEAEHYGEVLLEVIYDPYLHPEMNNYCEGCWQVRVYEPIALEYVKRLK